MKAKADLTALRYFVAAAEHGGYSRAAQALGLTQPAISRQIQSLERSHQTRLFRREGRALTLTPSGELLLEETRRILARIDALDHLVSTADAEPSGLLSIGITWATWGSLLPHVLGSFRGKYPKVFLRVIQDSTDRLADALVAHSIDMAVLYHRPRAPELDLVPLLESDMGLIVPCGEGGTPFRGLRQRASVTLARALQQPLIVPSRGNALRDLLDSQGRRERVMLNVAIEADSLPLTKFLVSAGHGCTVGTLASVHAETTRGALDFVPIRSPTMSWRMYAASAKNYPQSPAHKALLKALRAHIRDEHGMPSGHDRILD